MLTLVNIRDVDHIKHILFQDDLYEKIIDSTRNPREEFIPNRFGLWYLIEVDYQEVGLLLLSPLGEGMWEGHLGLLRAYRGKGYGTQTIALGTKILKEQFHAKKVLSQLLAKNQIPQRALKTLGWKFIKHYLDDSGQLHSYWESE